MPHIHTEAGQHDQTASAFIVRTDGPEPRLLLHMHKKLGRLLQVGGHIELNETPWQAIKHEIMEESGYELGQLKVLQPKNTIRQLTDATVHPVPLTLSTHRFDDKIDHYHTDHGYGFVTDEEPIHPVADGESLDIRWLTHQEISILTADLIFENVRQICCYVLSSCLDGSLTAIDAEEFDS